MYISIDILTIILSALLVFHSIKNIHRSSGYVYVLLLFAFYVFPIYLDYLLFFPNYIRYYGFNITFSDNLTRIIYDVSVLFCMFFIYKRASSSNISVQPINININHKALWIGCLLAPIVIIVLVRNINLLYWFQWRELQLFSAAKLNMFYTFAEKLSYIGICSSVLIILDKNSNLKKPLFAKVFAFLLLYANICLEGKRAALFFAIIVILVVLLFKYIYYKKRIITNRKNTIFVSILLPALMAIFLLVMSNFMYEYTIEVQVGRGLNDDIESVVTMSRIDFFRDDRVRMAIFSENNPERMKVLDCAGQTIWDKFKYIVPLNFVYGIFGLSNLTYQNYFTAALESSPVHAETNYMTVSIFAELISNFGIVIGVILFTILCIWLMKQTDRFIYPFNILIVLSFIIMNLFDMSYCIPFIQFCLIVLYIEHKNMKLVEK